VTVEWADGWVSGQPLLSQAEHIEHDVDRNFPEKSTMKSQASRSLSMAVNVAGERSRIWSFSANIVCGAKAAAIVARAVSSSEIVTTHSTANATSSNDSFVFSSISNASPRATTSSREIFSPLFTLPLLSSCSNEDTPW